MYDPPGTGDLVLPMPEMRTASELIEKGPLTVAATPTVPISVEKSGASTAGPTPQPATTHSPDTAVEKRGWVAIPNAPVTPKGTELWHYTDASGVISMIKNGTLWASSVAALNDSTEYLHGRELLGGLLAEVAASRNIHPAQKEYIAQIVALSDRIVDESGLFVLCASRAPHSLAQWRAYGGGSGHALVLDASEQLAVVADVDASYTIDSIIHCWRDVLYDEPSKIDLLLRVLGFLASETPVSKVPSEEALRSSATVVIAAIGHCKDESFAEEQESRYLVQAAGAGSLQFRASVTGVTPYVEVSGATRTSQRSRTREVPLSLPIKRVVVGPFGGRRESAQGARSLLSWRGLDHVPVEVSTSTLR